MERTWTDVGAEQIGKRRLEGGSRLTREKVEKAIDDLDWVDAEGEMSLPAMPGLGIQETIKQLRIPKVSKIAWRGKTETDEFLPFPLAPFGFYGIEGTYKNGRARVYVLDLGGEMTPLASDFWPADEKEEANADG